MRATLVLVVLLCVAGAKGAHRGAINPVYQIQSVVDQFFGLWALGNCTLWTSTFTPDGVFYHPKYPDGVVGSDQLMKFCVTNNENPQSTFRQDGALMVTVSGGLYFALAPYVYADSNPDLTVFINSGWESLVLVADASGSLLIQSATEFFATSSLPPVYTNQ